jgi:hypothetical protein
MRPAFAFGARFIFCYALPLVEDLAMHSFHVEET